MNLGDLGGRGYGELKEYQGFDVYPSTALFYALGGADVTIEGRLFNVERAIASDSGDVLYKYDIVANVKIEDTFTFAPDDFPRLYFAAYAAARYLETARIRKSFKTEISFTETYGKFYSYCPCRPWA